MAKRIGTAVREERKVRLHPERIALELDWPPTVNHYYRTVGGRMLISAAGRTYRRNVVADVAAAGAYYSLTGIAGRLRVWIAAYPPNRREIDLDNRLKPLLDAMQHACVFENDSQIDDLRIVRREVRKGGSVEVMIEPIDTANSLRSATEVER